MIYATKGNITLQTAIEQGKVCNYPVQRVEEDSRLLAAIARNEELLAQAALNTSTGANAQEQLTRYLSQKDRVVEERTVAPLWDLDPPTLQPCMRRGNNQHW